MSTRRTLGTGPTTTTRSTTSPRLLPAERGELDARLAGPADLEQTVLQNGRRMLGTGPKDGAS